MSRGSRSSRSRSGSIISEASLIHPSEFEDNTTALIQNLDIPSEERNALVSVKDKEGLYTNNSAARNYFDETTELSGIVRPSAKSEVSTVEYNELGQLNLSGNRRGMNMPSKLEIALGANFANDQEVINLVDNIPNITKEELSDLFDQALLDTVNIKGKRNKEEATRLGFIRRLELYEPFYYSRKEGQIGQSSIGRHTARTAGEKKSIALKARKYGKTYESVLNPSPEFFKGIEQQLTKKDIANLLREQLILKKGSKVSEKVSAIEAKTSQEGISGRGLKKKAQKKGGKISVGNLSKFFKSSYSGKKAPKKIDTYNLDSELTNKYGSVYYDPDKNHAVLTHKGTSGDTFLENAKDWSNNAMYAMGLYKYTDRYKQGKKLQTETENKYGAHNVSTLGHSQGNVLARELGQNSKEIIGLNPAYKGEKPLHNEYNIRSSGDVVSIGLHGTNRGHDTLIPAASLNPLTEHNIDILDRLDQNQMIGAGKYKKRKQY